MNELILAFNAAGVRYLLVGGQAMRLTGMPRFSMDWDFFIPPRDEENFARLNEILLQEELDVPLVSRSVRTVKISSRPIKPAGVSCNFILACPARRVLTRRKNRRSSVIQSRRTPVKCLSGIQMLAAKRVGGSSARPG
jgi:hypothetical protein